MRLGIIMKRFYTNRDLIEDRYGRMFHLPRELVKLGWEVSVFCPDFVKREALEREIDGVRFQSVPARLAGNWMSEKPWAGYQADVWMASGQLFAARQAAAVARKQGKPWALDFYDYYPAFFPAALHGLADVWARRLIRSSSGVIAASDRLERWAASVSGNVVRVPNGVDRTVFRLQDKSEMRERFRLGDSEALVGYFGSLTDDLGLSDALAAVEILRRKGIAATLVCAGRCAEFARIEAMGGKWFGMLPQSELAGLMGACDCVLAPYRESAQVHFSNSCRISEYIASGLPVVATRTGDYARYLPEGYAGLAEPNDVASLAAAIERQLTKSELVPLPEESDWEVLGKRLDGFLRGLC